MHDHDVVDEIGDEGVPLLRGRQPERQRQHVAGLRPSLVGVGLFSRGTSG
jgi:transposase